MRFITAVRTVHEPLPRGPHSLTREQVAASQRARLKRALVEIMSAGGFAAVTVRNLAQRAAVSRATFYEHYTDKEACLLEAYEDFARGLLEAMTADASDDVMEFLAATVDGYLGGLQGDLVAARAFLVEMDAAGPRARARRRREMHAFAAVVAERHRNLRDRDRRLGPLPDRVYLGLVLGVRELVHDRLEEEREPRLTELAPDVMAWTSAMFEGAAAATRLTS
jgi:AcrR family transcriptional regulator